MPGVTEASFQIVRGLGLGLANHRVPLLWRFHQVHHADARFHVTTGLRFHPGELLLALPFGEALRLPFLAPTRR
jgi:sterol desaturase/sphingolipid hydroxylase (fatty acid hydroxylase superfamily)